MTKYLLVILLAIFMMGAPSFAKADCMPEIELIDNVQKPVISIAEPPVYFTMQQKRMKTTDRSMADGSMKNPMQWFTE